MPNKEQLYEQATALGIKGRSKMSKEELAEAVAKADPRQVHDGPGANPRPEHRKAPPGGGYS
jgi:hypothetical protein